MDKNLRNIFYSNTELLKLLEGNESNLVKYIGLNLNGTILTLDVYKMVCLMPQLVRYVYDLNTMTLEYKDSFKLHPEHSIDYYQTNYIDIITN